MAFNVYYWWGAEGLECRPGFAPVERSGAVWPQPGRVLWAACSVSGRVGCCHAVPLSSLVGSLRGQSWAVSICLRLIRAVLVQPALAAQSTVEVSPGGNSVVYSASWPETSFRPGCLLSGAWSALWNPTGVCPLGAQGSAGVRVADFR